MRFVAKAELAKWPVAGRLIRGVGTLFVERDRRKDAHRVNGRAASALARGDIVAVFPEGTTTDGTDVLPFKSSLLQPIVDAQGHVQPVAIRYRAPTRRAFASRRRTSATTRSLESFWRVTRRASAGRRPARAARARRAASRTGAISRASAEAAIRTALAGRGCRDGTWNTRRSGSRIAVSVPPHRQPESSISTLGASTSSSVDQWPQTTVDARAPRGCRARTTARKPAGVLRGAALFAEFHRAVGRAVAQARAGVDDRAQAIVAGEVVAPCRGSSP